MQLNAIVEALLIASQNPLPSDEIARLVRARVAEAEDIRVRESEEGKEPQPLPDWLLALAATSAENVTDALAELNASYHQSHRAFTIIERPKGWKVFTRMEFGEFVRQLFPGRKPERMSGPAMETLAIIAYRQPITKSAIEAVRGVACDAPVPSAVRLKRAEPVGLKAQASRLSKTGILSPTYKACLFPL